MRLLFHFIESNKNHHAIYSRSDIRAIWYSDKKNTKVISLWIEFNIISLVILASVILVISILPLREDASPPVVLNMVFMLWYVFINSEDLAGAPYSSTRINETFLNLFPQCSDKKFENVKRCSFASGSKSKRVWSSRTYNHKSRGKSMNDFNIETHKLHLNHEPRCNFRDIHGWISRKFICLGQ